MKVGGVDGKTIAVYGALGFGAYLFVTKLLPDLIERLGKAAGDTAAGAAKGLAVGAGKTAGSVVMVAPRAIDSALEELGLPSQSLEKLGGAIGRGIYAATHVFSPSPAGPDLFYMVTFPDGVRHSIASTLVDSKGRFKYSGVMYQIKDDAAGKHFATRL